MVRCFVGHGGFGGHVYGVQELFAQTSFVWTPRYALTAQASVSHHMALKADPNTDAPSDTLASQPMDRLQPGLSAGWSWMFGRARLDLLKGGVFINPTPGFAKGYNKAHKFFCVPTVVGLSREARSAAACFMTARR